MGSGVMKGRGRTEEEVYRSMTCFQVAVGEKQAFEEPLQPRNRHCLGAGQPRGGGAATGKGSRFGKRTREKRTGNGDTGRIAAPKCARPRRTRLGFCGA